MTTPSGWDPNAQQNPSAPPPPPAGSPPPPPVPPVGGYAPAPYAGAPAYAYGPAMPPALQGKELADWWPRVGAALLDTLFVIFTLFIGFFVNFFLMARDGEKNGMTIGKQVVGIRLVKEDGQPVTLGFGLLRDFVVEGLLIGFIGGFFFFPPLLDVLWPLWDDKNQTLHDKMVSSYVVKA